MSSDGLRFDDFDLDLHTNVSQDESGSEIEPAAVSAGTGFNSSTSVCCAIATNVTEDCSWCAGCW